ncbi:MAG: SpoIIE family protein phosphatase [Wujia sp.]
MSVTRFLNGIWIGLAGLFIGCTEMFGVCPLAVAFLASVCMYGKGVPAAYIGLMCGMAIKLPMVEFARYGIVMLGIAMLLCGKAFDTTGRNVYLMAFFSGLVSFGVGISVYVFVPGNLKLSEVCIEAIIVMSVSIIFYKGIKTIAEDSMSIVTDNEAAIAVLVLGATILYGMPVDLGDVALAEAFALYSIFCALYKFGFGIGISWTVVCGAILAYTAENTIYITAWVPMVVAAYGLLNTIHGKRITFVILFTTIYYLCGSLFFQELLDINGQKSVLSALFVFLLTPSSLLLQIDSRAKNGELAENSPEWSRLVIDKVNDLAQAFKRIDYTMAFSSGDTGVALSDVGEIIEEFTTKLDKPVQLRKTIESKIIEELSAYHIQLKNLVVVRNNDNRFEVYLTGRITRGRLVSAEPVKRILEDNIGVPFELLPESRNIIGRNYEVICMRQKPAFICRTAVRRLSRYDDQVSGDNFYIGDLQDGQKLIIIADGMGNGEKAARDSETLIEAMEELLSAGLDKDTSIKLVNSFLAEKNHGESFATLDMFIVDMHTGYGRIYKQGAAATYIKRGEWMELIKSTSLPMGVVEGAVCEKCSRKMYDGDIVVMMSDGMSESIIVENKEDYMRDLLMAIDYEEPEDIAEEVMDRVMALSGNRLRDDATIIVCKLVKSL